MKTKNILIIGVLACTSAFAQLNSLIQTSLSAAITNTQTQFNIASATGVVAPSAFSPSAGSALWIQDIGNSMGEVVNVQAVSGTQVTVRRVAGKATAHASGAMVLVATAQNWFYATDAQGTCTASTVYVAPYLNTVNGRQFQCSSKTGTWVPSWGTASGATAEVLSATATASAAGATAISGPYLEISGTNAITSFTMSTGWNGQGFCVYPTGAFTITATNNIAKAATAVADRTLCFYYNANTSKFSPSY